jgi:hypothetical protein
MMATAAVIVFSPCPEGDQLDVIAGTQHAEKFDGTGC